MAPILGIWASSRPTVAPDLGSMFPLGTFTLSSAQSQIDFTNIPNTYTHLQLRAFYVCSNSAGTIRMRVGGSSIDTSTVYNSHTVQGDGSSATANSFGGSAANESYLLSSSQDTFGFTFVMDFLDYKNTNKNKTIRHLSGGDGNGSGRVGLGSVLWAQASTAIGSIRLYPQAGTFNANSSFALYGVL